MHTVALVSVYAASIAAAVLLITVALNTPRITPARLALAGFLLTTVVWTAIALVYVVRRPDDPTLSIVWVLPVVALMVAFVRMLVQALSNAAWRPSGWYVGSLLVHPVGMAVVAAVPPWHHLVISVHDDGSASYVGLFWVHAALSYGMLISSLVVLTSARRSIPALAKRRFGAMLVSWSFPVIANVYTIAVEGANGVDVTPVAFILTALFLGRSMIADGLADVIPVARVQVFESLTDAVLVLDTADRLIDANARGVRILSLVGFDGAYHGLRLDQISPELDRVLATSGERDVEVSGGEYVAQIDRTELGDRKGRAVGTLIHIRNVTENALRTRELIRVRDALAAEARLNEQLRAELADQVVRDSGTGLHNRRYVFDTLPDIVARCEAHHLPLAIIMMDIDDFKSINDTYGHAAGDRALAAVASAMSDAAHGAVVARFGGEEFIVVLEGESREDALRRAEAVRAACAAVAVPAREGSISITMSAGVAWSGPEGLVAAHLIERADDALYEAKRTGRDRTCVAWGVPD